MSATSPRRWLRDARRALARLPNLRMGRVPDAPAHPVRDPYDGAYGAHDFRSLARREDLLTFETTAFDRPVEVIGAIVAELFLETDARDVDLYVRVLDVAPDGTAYNLMSPGLELVRASYREPERGRTCMRRPGISRPGTSCASTSWGRSSHTSR